MDNIVHYRKNVIPKCYFHPDRIAFYFVRKNDESADVCNQCFQELSENNEMKTIFQLELPEVPINERSEISIIMNVKRFQDFGNKRKKVYSNENDQSILSLLAMIAKNNQPIATKTKISGEEFLSRNYEGYTFFYNLNDSKLLFAKNKHETFLFK